MPDRRHDSAKAWRKQGKGETFGARVVNYADDFVILIRGPAEASLVWTWQVRTNSHRAHC